MRNLVFVLFAAVLICVCSCGGSTAPNPDEVAARAAKLYYDYLREGKYEAYVDGFHRPDSIPGSYRDQLVVNAKMYAAQMKEDHGGLAAVEIAGARTDTARHVGHAFLVLCFGDSVREEIVVPMVLHDGNWMLR